MRFNVNIHLKLNDYEENDLYRPNAHFHHLWKRVIICKDMGNTI